CIAAPSQGHSIAGLERIRVGAAAVRDFHPAHDRIGVTSGGPDNALFKSASTHTHKADVQRTFDDRRFVPKPTYAVQQKTTRSPCRRATGALWGVHGL